MPAPTNVRVESNSLTTATVRWSYSGALPIRVYRSTDGISYTEITDALTRVAVGTLLYADSSLATQTKYWYKLSEDGIAFSSVVTVITQACLPPAGSLDTFSLPRASDTVVSDEFNNLAERVENILGGRLLAPNDCITCPSDGAVILNCAGHCREWIVVADEDINSISMQFCDEGDGSVQFVIPPNVTRRITGFPDGFGGYDLPFITSGASGRTVSVPISKTGGKAKPTSSAPGTGSGIGKGGGKSGSGSGSGACNCSPSNFGITIKSCNANNSLKCSSTKTLQLIACGGRGPYTWSKTGNIILSNTSGSIINVSVPANAGSGVAGTAYIDQARNCFSGGCTGSNCTTANPIVTAQYGCNDNFITCTGWAGANCATPDSVASVCCPNAERPCTDGSLSCPNFINSDGYRCQLDVRTAGMIASGCAPCGVIAAGATVTVTDTVGNLTTIILRP